ncbi:MAG TPA: urate hydroxylase PuuD, partial [Bdellovibrionota bacterium]
MATSLELWFEYILRFSHLVAGISWIGSSFYFIWLDSSFLPPEVARKNVEGELFMVHGGFYYQVEKKKIYPGELPKTLHWFKWEATLTWITGFFLFTVLYYLQGASLLVDSSIKTLTQTQAIGLSLGILTLSWLIYDLLIWKADLPLPKAVRLLMSVVFLSLLIFGNFAIFSGRGAFMQTGMVFGSIMLLNVWIRILPGQAKMLREAQAGQVPDYSVSLKSKVRSVHNTYFTFPVLFIMLSNHFPAIYNHPQNAWLLIGLAISGALVRHAMVTKNPQ